MPAHPPAHPNETPLAELRERIDRIDQQLLTALAQRAELTAAVGVVKHQYGLPLYAPDREAQLFSDRRRQAVAAGVDPDLFEDVLRRLMRESYSSQQARFPATGDCARAVVIVGGHGALGRLLADFFARSGYPVRVLERDDWPQAAQIVDNAALVLIAVPIADTCQVIAQLPRLPADCLLADVTSIKRAPVTAMLAAHPGPVLGLHPMFGPDVRSLAKQVVVVCPGRQPSSARWLLDQFGLWGAVLREEAAEQHDRSMALIQAMRHFSSLLYGLFLAREGADLNALLRLSSPIYRLELTMVGRLFAQSPALYADIMLAAEQLPELIAHYRGTLDDLLDHIRTGQRDALITAFDQAAGYFGDLAPTLLRESGELLRKAHDARDPLRDPH